MRVLLIGVLVFILWALLSSYVYVCQIKHMCGAPVDTLTEPVTQTDTLSSDETIAADTTAQAPLSVPADLTVHFAFNEAEFVSNAAIDSRINELKAYTEQNADAVIAITGHTDATGSDEYNMDLGSRRAQSVKTYFENKGLSSGKITVESQGEKSPVGDNETEEGKANNRRTEITLKK